MKDHEAARSERIENGPGPAQDQGQAPTAAGQETVAQLGFLGLILVYGLLLIATMGDLSADARLFPSLVLGSVGLLWALCLGATLTRGRRGHRRGPVRRSPPQGTTGQTATPRARTVWAWVAACLLLMLIFGFLVGTGLAILLYLRLVARERWAHAIAASAITSLVVYVVFGRALRVDLGVGLVPGLF